METLIEKYPELVQYEDRPVSDLRKIIKKIEAQRRRKEYDAYMQDYLARQRERRAKPRRK